MIPTSKNVITSVVEPAAESIQEANIDQSLKDAAKAAIFAPVVQDQGNDFPNTPAGRIVHNQIHVMEGLTNAPVDVAEVNAVSPATKLSAKIQAEDTLTLPYNNALLQELFPTLTPAQIDQLRDADVLDSLITLRKIFLHPNPQNKMQGENPRPGIVALKKGYEVQGILGLTTWDPSVTRQDVITFFTTEVNRVMSATLVESLEPKAVLYDQLVALARTKHISNPEQFVARIPADLRELIPEKITLEEILSLPQNELFKFTPIATLIKTDVISFKDYQNLTLDQKKSVLKYAANSELRSKYKTLQAYLATPVWKSELIDECKLTEQEVSTLKPTEYAPVAVLLKNSIIKFQEYKNLSSARKAILVKFANWASAARLQEMSSSRMYQEFSLTNKILLLNLFMNPTIINKYASFPEYIISAPLEVPHDISRTVLEERLSILLQLIDQEFRTAASLDIDSPTPKISLRQLQQTFYHAALQACIDQVPPKQLFDNQEFIDKVSEYYDSQNEAHADFIMSVLPPEYLGLYNKLLLASVKRKVLHKAQEAGIQNPQQFVDSMPEMMRYCIVNENIPLERYQQLLQDYKNLPQEYQQLPRETQNNILSYLRNPQLSTIHGSLQNYIGSQQGDVTDFSQQPALATLLLTSKAMHNLSHQLLINLFTYISQPDIKANLKQLPRDIPTASSWTSFKYRADNRWAEGVENIKAGLMYQALFDDTGKRRALSVTQGKLIQIYQDPDLKQILDTHTGIAVGQTDASKDIGQLINKQHDIAAVSNIIEQIAQRISHR